MSFLGVARSLKTLKVLFFVCLFISATYILFFLWYCIRSYPIPFLNPKLLGDVVLAIDPSVDARKWNIATSKVNDALHDLGHWKTPYYFFDRAQCWCVFHQYILRFDAEAAEQYRQVVNNYFDDLLQNESSNCGAQLGKDPDVKFLTNKSFLKPTFPLTIYFAFLSTGYMRGNKIEKDSLDDGIGDT